MVKGIHYEVVKKLEKVEIRRYPQIVLAKVDGYGDDGFNLLFKFITGENRQRAKVAMTAPVISEKITITAPVISTEGSIAFVMPESFTRESTPEPVDERVRIVELWEQNVIGIADEHFATDLALQLIQTVSEKARSFRRGDRGTALLCCVEGEYHSVGLTMLAELLRDAGLNVQLMGPDRSFASILDAVRKSSAGVELICLSVTMPFNLPNLVRTLKLVRGEPALKEVPVMVGGRIPESHGAEKLPREAGDIAKLADFVASSLTDALKYVTGLLETKSLASG